MPRASFRSACGSPVQRVAWSECGVTAILQNGEKIEAERALITVPVGLLRAGLPALDPPPPEDQRKAIGRLGYGAGILGKIYLRFPRRFWPERPKWFGRLPDCARAARHLQHLGQPRAGDRTTDPAQLQQRRDGRAP